MGRGSSRLERPIYAGDDGCTGGRPLQPCPDTGRGIGKTPVLAWIHTGHGVDSALTMRVLTIVHCAPPSPVTHALVFTGDHSHGESQISRITQCTQRTGRGSDSALQGKVFPLWCLLPASSLTKCLGTVWVLPNSFPKLT
jgi:hypothetical protein